MIKTIAVIGGGGKMGQWLARHLAGEGRPVIVADTDPARLKEIQRTAGVSIAQNSVEAVRPADIVILSVPIGALEPVVKEIAPHLRPGQIVMDITSIKAGPVAVMHRYIKNALVLGTHPLFGPGAGLKGQNFILTPTDDRENALALKVGCYLAERGASVKIMAPEQHDRMMAVVQGLTHFTAIIATDALAGLGPLAEMQAASTTTFRSFVSYISTVIGDDPALYAAIQMAYPQMPEIYAALEASLKKWADAVARQDAPAFIDGMKRLQGYLGGG